MSLDDANALFFGGGGPIYRFTVLMAALMAGFLTGFLGWLVSDIIHDWHGVNPEPLKVDLGWFAYPFIGLKTFGEIAGTLGGYVTPKVYARRLRRSVG